MSSASSQVPSTEIHQFRLARYDPLTSEHAKLQTSNISFLDLTKLGIVRNGLLTMGNPENAEDESREDVFAHDNPNSRIAKHAAKCQSLLQEYMARPEIVPDPAILDEQLARFSLWASNMDVYGHSNVSLDWRLRFSPTPADIVHQLLSLICDTLLSREYYPDHSWLIRSKG